MTTINTPIDCDTPLSVIESMLNKLGWLADEKILKTEVPGEGNMNVVLKVTTTKRQFVLKQSRPFVNKYQQIAAPLERINTELRFFEAIKHSSISDSIPNVDAFDKPNYLMMSEYIENATCMDTIYKERSIAEDKLIQLIDIVGEIHKIAPSVNYPENRVLRELNHQHIFVLPFISENGFDLDEVQDGLASLSAIFKEDSKVKHVVGEVGRRYLGEGDCLLHGDYYPGSWLISNNKPYVIDAEFSFIGFKEFDIGVMIAHLIMATSQSAYLDYILKAYPHSLDEALARQVAGIEIARRLIGLAQLPLTRTINEKEALLDIAYQFIVQ